jgi:hypothetical protein
MRIRTECVGCGEMFEKDEGSDVPPVCFWCLIEEIKEEQFWSEVKKELEDYKPS